MRRLRDCKRTQALLSCFGPIRQHFALERHLLPASLYRKHPAVRLAAWREFTDLTPQSVECLLTNGDLCHRFVSLPAS
ncbi:hypothetical protein B0G73_13655 [Paraburkholderia sp. BL25I1N1]|nr:hypothetical protein B0G73_13655 [Paraburkholderia sp. BL25I1N1]